jgi:hypothetical protein
MQRCGCISFSLIGSAKACCSLRSDEANYGNKPDQPKKQQPVIAESDDHDERAGESRFLSQSATDGECLSKQESIQPMIDIAAVLRCNAAVRTVEAKLSR